MGERIHEYFVTLGLDHEEASELHLRYYTQYGLALRGLTRHHDIGNVIHAERVLRILQLDDLIDGLVYCDYELKDFSCKPEPDFYQQAMKRANLSDPSKCYFIDDNRGNIDGARAQGWAKCVHFCEKGLEAMEGGRTKQIDNERAPGAEDDDGVDVVTTLEELRVVWREIFKE
ncbi:hypothetical protein H0H81_004941 [Sphagnurus paluster]|uniref:Pyrimidine 5-nucleotidase n=1 Tax=Sphagnurus paluster TaxID=117069 RepID=A0A9P7G1S7_9AGAR|nr:hypothetical protein H0H81_004941 [Sphagnurus paluster]